MIPLIKPFLPIREIIGSIKKVLKSKQLSSGTNVDKFELEFSQLIGNPYVLALNSGTSALQIALRIIGVSVNSEVISTALTAEPTNTVILNSGARVVFADVDPQTGLISPESIEKRITPKTSAIIIVHYAGMVCDLDKINEISEKYQIPVIEDAAHAFMAKYNGNYIGSNSRFTCFSFQAIKHITTIDGGMLCLTNQEDYNRAKKLRWFGLNRDIPRLENDIIEAGYKYNMNNVTAAIGIVQLNYLKKNVLKYIDNGIYYDKYLDDIPGVTLIKYYNNTKPSYWLYTLRVTNRDSFIAYMKRNGIESSPLHLRNDRHTVFRNPNTLLPGLDKFYSEFVHIPCGWWVNKRLRKKIVNTISKGEWS
jgi:perosamine synthetase